MPPHCSGSLTCSRNPIPPLFPRRIHRPEACASGPSAGHNDTLAATTIPPWIPSPSTTSLKTAAVGSLAAKCRNCGHRDEERDPADSCMGAGTARIRPHPCRRFMGGASGPHGDGVEGALRVRWRHVPKKGRSHPVHGASGIEKRSPRHETLSDAVVRPSGPVRHRGAVLPSVTY